MSNPKLNKSDLIKIKILLNLNVIDDITINKLCDNVVKDKKTNRQTIENALFFLEQLGLIELFSKRHGLNEYKYVKITRLGKDITFYWMEQEKIHKWRDYW